MNLTELFKNTFEPELLEEMEKNSTLMTAKEGDVIIDIGNTIRLIPLILKGSVRISRKDLHRRRTGCHIRP